MLLVLSPHLFKLRQTVLLLEVINLVVEPMILSFSVGNRRIVQTAMHTPRPMQLGFLRPIWTKSVCDTTGYHNVIRIPGMSEAIKNFDCQSTFHNDIPLSSPYRCRAHVGTAANSVQSDRIGGGSCGED